MKRSTLKIALVMMAVIFSTSTFAQSQTITGTVITQPCNGNGHLAVTVAGLTPPINYTYTNWVGGQTIVHTAVTSVTDNLTGISAYYIQWGSANTWYVSASDGVNTEYGSFVLNPAFSIDSVKVIPANCPALSTVQATFSGGTPPFSAVWTNLATFQTFNSNPAAVPNGQYGIQATDGAGCTMLSSPTGSGNIYVSSFSNMLLTVNGSPANCTNGTATVTVSNGTPPYSYLWSNSAVTPTLSGLSMGQYSCLVTDAIGCQQAINYYQTQSVSLNINNTVNNATCLQNNGSVTSFVNGGTAPYTYLWSNAATTQNISGIPGGMYIAQVTDAAGCIGISYAYVGVSTPISVTYSATPSSCTSANGSATIAPAGGAPPYTVLWYLFPANSGGTSISGKPSGSFQFKVTDANGCIQTGSAYIPPASSINAALMANAVICPATTGNITSNVSGSSPPFSYSWSNAGTGSSISGVPLGAYSCTITDAAGCSVVKYESLVQSSPINLGLNAAPASCIFSSNGVITANATGGTAPYTYAWSNSQAGASINGLTSGYYNVTVTDANGCKQHAQGFVGYNSANNTCYCTITGTVYTDANSNCVKNTGEAGVPNVQVHCSGFGYAYTNASGVYSFKVPTGTYTITESIQQLYPLASCQSNNQVVTVTAAANCVSTVNFANNVIPLSDLHIITSSLNWPVPGNSYNQKVIVQNEGTVTESNIKLGYAHDGKLTYSSCIPWALTQQNATSYPNWYSITSGFSTLAPASSTAAYISYTVPTNIPINTMVEFKDTVAKAAPISTTWLTDNTPWNNVNSHQTYVIGSFDPNFKEVTPKGAGPEGNLTSSADSILTYVVHFQNTGSYFAQKVEVVDTIDSDLRLSTLRPGYSDHGYTATVSDNGVAKFTFENINLPWQSAYGDVLSSGMFTYSIKLKKNLAQGTKIKNKAAIYFDYNEPVITNTTINTIAYLVSGVDDTRRSKANEMVLFPNPAGNLFTVLIQSARSGPGMITLYDISGREVSQESVAIHEGANSFAEKTDQLQNGIYFVQLKGAGISASQKLVISK
jgi:hypothetical protein